MRRKVIVGLLLVAAAGMSAAQSYWQKTCGGTSDECASAVVSTPDGKIYIAGYKTTYDTSFVSGVKRDMCFVKINPGGETILSKIYGGTNYTGANTITATPDGNFIIAGYFAFSDSGTWDLFIEKVTSNGDTVWTKTFGGVGDDWAEAIISTADGNFLVQGGTSSRGAGEQDVYLLKIKPNGDTLWTKTYGADRNDYGKTIIPTMDGNFIIAGFTESFESRNDNAYFLKIKPNGDTVWTRNYGGTKATNLLGYWKDYWADAIVQTADGNFIAAGVGFSTDLPQAYYSCLFKIGLNGDTLWTKNIGYGWWNSNYTVTSTKDQNVLLAVDDTLRKVTPNGDVLWIKAMSIPFSRPVGFANTPDGNYVCVLNTNPGISLFYIVDDSYAYSNTLFTFKIPVYDDSLNHSYTPFKAPAGMTVSLGGTISWTPTTDSSYMDHVEFLVTDDFGKKDTLTFNIFVNSKDHPTKALNPVSRTANPLLNDLTVRQLSSKEVRFSLPSGTKSLSIYNIHGQLLENISITGNQAAWLPRHAAGRYFAKAIWEKREAVKPFIILK